MIRRCWSVWVGEPSFGPAKIPGTPRNKGSGPASDSARHCAADSIANEAVPRPSGSSVRTIRTGPCEAPGTSSAGACSTASTRQPFAANARAAALPYTPNPMTAISTDFTASYSLSFIAPIAILRYDSTVAYSPRLDFREGIEVNEVVDASHRKYIQTLTAPAAKKEGLQATSATLSYFGVNVARRVGMTPAAMRQYFDNSPFVSALMATSLGNATVITLPLTYLDMVRDKKEAVRYAQMGLELARTMGVEHVSLAGLLASALDYGHLLDAPPGFLTTGHATTASSVLKTIEAVLTSTRREWGSETVAVLGLGSIGRTTVTTALATFGNPGRLILADLASKEPEVRTLGEQLESEHPGLEWSFVNPAQPDQNPLYDSTVVVGCTSTPNVLQVDRLRPGCIVVDDSVPHCFDVGRAIARADETMDLILANGGLLQLPERFPVLSFAPRLLHDSLGW